MATPDEEAERAEQARRQQVLGRMASGIAHDFNNLLMVIAGSLESILLLDDRDKIRQTAQRALGASDRGTRLISALMTFSRAETGIRCVNLNDLLHGSLQFLIEQSVGSGVRVQFDLAPDLANCDLDPIQFESMMVNLVVNARDAMAGGGTLVITTRNNVTDPTVPPSFVAVSVMDTGCGMPEEVKGRIFEPFFSTKPPTRGSGIGLTQVNEFVSACGGRIAVVSKPGHGTTITILFPCSPAA